MKRPRQFETDRIILFAFGQIISDCNKEQSEQHGNEELHTYAFAHCGGISKGRQNDAQCGNDPKNQMQNFFGMVLLFGIGKRNANGKPMDCKQDQRKSEHREGLTAVAVDLSLHIPVRRNLFGKLIPENYACENRQKNCQGCTSA